MSHTYQKYLAKVKPYYCVVEGTVGDYSGYIPDMLGVIATGDTVQSVLEDLSKGMYFHISSALQDGDAIHPPRDIPEFTPEDLPEEDYVLEPVKPYIPDAVSWAIQELLDSSGVKKSELAQRLNLPKSVVSRLTSPFYHGHSMETLRKISKALGHTLHVEFVKT